MKLKVLGLNKKTLLLVDSNIFDAYNKTWSHSGLREEVRIFKRWTYRISLLFLFLVETPYLSSGPWTRIACFTGPETDENKSCSGPKQKICNGNKTNSGPEQEKDSDRTPDQVTNQSIFHLVPLLSR